MKKPEDTPTSTSAPAEPTENFDTQSQGKIIITFVVSLFNLYTFL